MNKVNVYSNLALQVSFVEGITYSYDEYYNFLVKSESNLNLVYVFQSFKPIRSKEVFLRFLRSFSGNNKVLIITDDPNFFKSLIENNLHYIPIIAAGWLVNQKNLNLKNLRRFQNPWNKTGMNSFDLLLRSLIESSTLPSLKVICCDFDKTLWGGIIGEYSNYSGLFVEQSHELHLSLQRLLLSLKEKGILLVLTTKNNPDDVNEFFGQNPEMPIGLNDFVLIYANWNSKVQNIQLASKNLNLGLDSFMFIDDSDLEVLLVREELGIETFQFPDPLKDDYSRDKCELLHSNLRISESLIKKSVDKTKQYKENFKREEVLNIESTDLDNLNAFELLGVKLDFKINDVDYQRISEMSEKTNQFNCNKRILSSNDVKHLIFEGNDFITCSATDNFGDYGIIGYIHIDNKRIVNFVMSCRALSRGIEEKFIDFVLNNFTNVSHLDFKESPRNAPAKSFVLSMKNVLKIAIK